MRPGSPPPTILSYNGKLHEGWVAEQFDRVVLDTPPTSDLLLISALAAADGVLIPFVPHHLAAVGVNQLARLFYRVATRYNPSLQLIALLPVMVNRNFTLQRKVLDELAIQFGKGRLLRGIRTNIRLAEAFAAGEPICRFAPRSPGAMDYQLLADELETVWLNNRT